jgi:hypothetical protein
MMEEDKYVPRSLHAKAFTVTYTGWYRLLNLGTELDRLAGEFAETNEGQKTQLIRGRYGPAQSTKHSRSRGAE